MKTISSTDVTPGTSGSFQDVDITAYVGADAGSIALAIVRYYGGTCGLRANGSTDTQWAGDSQKDWNLTCVPVDSSDIFEANVAAATTLELIGYFTTAEADSVGRHSLDGIDIKPANPTGAFTDLDLTSVSSATARVAVVYMRASHFNPANYAHRLNGSTFDRYSSSWEGRNGWGAHLMVMDTAQILEHQSGFAAADWTNTSMCIMGWIDDVVAVHDPPTDMAMNTTGAWTTKAAASLDATTVGLLLLMVSTNNQSFVAGLRETGSAATYQAATANNRHSTSMLAVDGSDQIDIYIADNRLDTFVWVEFAEPSGGGPAPIKRTLMMTGMGR